MRFLMNCGSEILHEKCRIFLIIGDFNMAEEELKQDNDEDFDDHNETYEEDLELDE